MIVNLSWMITYLGLWHFWLISIDFNLNLNGYGNGNVYKINKL